MWFSIVAVFQEFLKLLNNILPTRKDLKQDAIEKQQRDTDRDIDKFIDAP